MASKLKYLPVLFWALSSCTNGDLNGKGYIGTEISDESGLYNSYGIETSSVFIVDETTDRLLGIRLADLSIAHQFELKNKDKEHYVAVDINEKFVIDFSKKHLNIYGLDGLVQDRPFNFQGVPQSVAYNPYTRTMVMQDNLQSVGIMQLGANGAVEKSWLGGPQLSNEQSIVAGDLDKAGRLVLSLSDNSLSVVDIAETLSKESWQQSSFSPNLGAVKWIAPDSLNGDLVLAASTTNIAIVNVSTKAVVEQKALDSSTIVKSVSKAGRPHLYTVKGGLVTLYYITSQGALGIESLSQASIEGLRQSYMDANASSITMLFAKGYRSNSVLKLRLSDALVIVEKDINTEGDTSINGKSVFVNFKDPLGAIELYSLETDDFKRLDGYNFDYLRTHY